MGLFNKEEEEKVAIDLFPGSLEEYNSMKGAKYVIMDTGRSEKYVQIFKQVLGYKTEKELLSSLIEQGCCALVRFNQTKHVAGPVFSLGIPVKKVNK